MTKKKKKSRIYIIWIVNLCLITAVVAFFVWYESVPDVSPEKVLKTYMAHISNREYEQMYEMIDAGISGNISQEDFVKRNSAIYEGIGVDNIKIHITSYDKEQKEMYNRFRQVWCPGSTFKPIIAAIGLTTGAIDPNEDYGNEGLSWQKDSSWGSYHVTTLHAYEPVILKNALIYSDNIYFAKAALKIGERDMESSLTKLGFNEELPFDIKVAKSQFSNTDKIEKEIQLADSGYGQGQILVNPLHMACIYSAFCNEGNMIKPYLTYKEDAIPNVWITAAFTKDAAQMVLEDTKEVINNPHGTGYAACRTDITLAGKTGTAEIKASKEDTTGTELGWFSVFTTDENMDRPIMIISMVEDVKGRGGSGYVVKKDSQVLEKWLSDN